MMPYEQMKEEKSPSQPQPPTHPSFGQPYPGPVNVHPGPVVQASPQVANLPVLTATPGQQGMGQPVVLMKSPKKPMSQTKARFLLGLGITQVVTGSLAIIFNIITTATMSSVSAYVGAGYWCGILYIIAGSFGIVGSRKRTNGFLVTFMVLSIISSVLTTGIISTAAVSLGESSSYYYYYNYRDLGLATNVILLLCGLVELVIAIISSALCCSVVCCQDTQYVACPVQYQAGTSGVTIGQPIQGQVIIPQQTVMTA